MPGDVTEFLQHVHAEKAKIKPTTDEQEIADEEQLFYYDTDNELSTILTQEQNQWERRHKRMFKDNNYLRNYIIDLPIGEHSSNWNLVTNDDIGMIFFFFFSVSFSISTLIVNLFICCYRLDDLLDDTSSFIYGQSPSTGNVPIYAMVNMCNANIFKNEPENGNLIL